MQPYHSHSLTDQDPVPSRSEWLSSLLHALVPCHQAQARPNRRVITVMYRIECIRIFMHNGIAEDRLLSWELPGKFTWSSDALIGVDPLFSVWLPSDKKDPKLMSIHWYSRKSNSEHRPADSIHSTDQVPGRLSMPCSLRDKVQSPNTRIPMLRLFRTRSHRLCFSARLNLTCSLAAQNVHVHTSIHVLITCMLIIQFCSQLFVLSIFKQVHIWDYSRISVTLDL
jgi:hypothetical protein